METNLEDTISLLNEIYIWPTPYPFSFIVLAEHLEELKSILGNAEFNLKKSSAGKYVGLSTDIVMHSAQDVLDVYAKVKVIKGIRSL